VNSALSQGSVVYGWLGIGADSAASGSEAAHDPERPCREKLKRRAKDDPKDRHFEAALIVQAISWYLRYPHRASDNCA